MMMQMSAVPQLPPGVVAVDDYEPLAREALPPAIWEWLDGGAADGLTMKRNREAFQQLRLQGRVLHDMTGANTRLTLFGQTLDFPILLAPIAYHKLLHPDGELATVSGASAMRAGMIVSTNATVLIEDIARVAQTPLWFQLYMLEDRGFSRDLVQRAEAAGYQALVVTVDAPVNGVRNREARAGFRLPPDVERVNLRGLSRPYPSPAPRLVDSPLFNGFLASAPTWKDVAWLRSITRLPVLLKGVMAPGDAARALDEGAAGLVVSNHGGRVLDTLPAAIEALPRIADVVGDKMPLLVDGGVRRGTDILKALALGAKAVLVGRPYAYGLAAAGALGVAHVISILRAELEVAMTLTGCATLEEIDRSVLWDEPPIGGRNSRTL
jgi:4-hydroxymandelate oxidase